MNDIFAQKMALRSNALSGIMQALAQMKKKQDEEALMQQDNIMQQSNPLMVDRSFTVGDIPRPETQVTTDLLGKPIIGNVNGNYRGQNFQTQAPISIGIPRVQESQQVNPQFSLANLLVQLQSQNPVTQNRVNQFAKAPAIASAFANKTEQLDPTKDTQTTDWMGNPISQTKGVPKEQKPLKVGIATEKGRKVAVYMNPDRTTYKVDLGESFDEGRLKLAKENIELSKKRFEESKNQNVKTEGKYLITLFNKAESEYNRNQIYLADENLNPAMKAQIEQQQTELLNEMNQYGQSIDALGKTTSEVIAPKSNTNNAQKAKPKPKLF